MQYPAGTRLSGKVRNLTSFGAFVEIEPGIDGLIHVSDMSWTKRVEHPSEVVNKGDDIDVIVLDIDADQKRISLGIKQMTEDPWEQIAERFAPGVEQQGKVTRLQDKGIVVDLGDDIEGFVPASHSAVDDANELDQFYAPGDGVDLRVLESDAVNRRIVLEVTTTPTRKPRPVEVEVEVPIDGDAVAEEPTAEGSVVESVMDDEVLAEGAVAEEPASEGVEG
jgi:small subunit ribosomal protein S1